MATRGQVRRFAAMAGLCVLLNACAATDLRAPSGEEPPYSNADLLRAFEAVALRSEFSEGAADAPARLTRWRAPVRYRIEGGGGADIGRVAALAARLRRASGHDVAPARADETPNMVLRFVGPSDREAAARRIGEVADWAPLSWLADRWANGGPEPCFALVKPDAEGALVQAEILIRDELSTRLRDACVIEEVTQSLGLMNDSPLADPSVFNDDQRYLDLTSFDEHLLRVLYDPRLKPGMSAPEAMPVAARVIAEIRPHGAPRAMAATP